MFPTRIAQLLNISFIIPASHTPNYTQNPTRYPNYFPVNESPIFNVALRGISPIEVPPTYVPAALSCTISAVTTMMSLSMSVKSPLNSSVPTR